MKAKIIGVDPLKESRTEKAFRRVYFTLEDGNWAKTDIVPAYRNFKIWKPILNLVDMGATIFIDGVELRRAGEVDADSLVRIIQNGFEIKKTKEKKLIQSTLL